MGAQNTYRFSTPIGQAGGIYDLAPYAVDSFVNEADDGVLKFGAGVVRGTNAGTGVKAPNSESLASQFEGIITNRRTSENALAGGVQLRKGCSLGVLRYGRIYGRVMTGISPAYGDPVYLVITGDEAGDFTNVAATTGTNDATYTSIAVKGRFLSGKSDDIALIELFNQAQA